ncbi:UNVERIFIED_CONTAM: hypothetical protein Slati_0938100 [Sesamum latifolium]|uniref:Uncharacterized protein n=1 Tax=Sesamum latifolium TaxID=2727402 RepID=A0AAW2XP90_9LAMI
MQARPLLEEGCYWANGMWVQEDRWKWHFHRNGCFTVCSAYKQAIIMRERGVASSSRPDPTSSIQRGTLWRMILSAGSPQGCSCGTCVLICCLRLKTWDVVSPISIQNVGPVACKWNL